jgi:hypothetical protein
MEITTLILSSFGALLTFLLAWILYFVKKGDTRIEDHSKRIGDVETEVKVLKVRYETVAALLKSLDAKMELLAAPDFLEKRCPFYHAHMQKECKNE